MSVRNEASTPKSAGDAYVAKLCLNCGLCCNGVLFRDVELEPGDSATKLEALGLTLQRLKTKTRFPQPCTALGADCRCGVYADRPSHCRNFECGLLQSVAAGKLEVAAALRTIKQARQRAEKVRALLRALGEDNEHLPFSRRYRRVKQRIESGPLDDETAANYADLSMAVHDLNFLLHQSFYAHATE